MKNIKVMRRTRLFKDYPRPRRRKSCDGLCGRSILVDLRDRRTAKFCWMCNWEWSSLG